jgi:hypothetical protein
MVRYKVGVSVFMLFACSQAISQNDKADPLLLGKWEAQIMFAGATATIHLELCNDGRVLGEMRDEKGEPFSKKKGKYTILENSYLEWSMVDDKNAKKKDTQKFKYRVTKDS